MTGDSRADFTASSGRVGFFYFPQLGDKSERRIEAIDFTQFLGAIPAALIPVALVLYFSDQNTKNWMNERREITLAILNERKEWLAERKDTIERQFSIQEKTVLEIAGMKAEDHAQRGVLQQLANEVGAMKLHVHALSKGKSAND